MARSDKVTCPMPLSRERAAPAARDFRLLVVADGAVLATHSLPEAGTITIGRDHSNTIRIEDDSISRKHAALHVGSEFRIVDLGSFNGTKIRDALIQPHVPHELAPNELVTLGCLSLMIQARFAPAQTCHLATHDYFQARIEEECARGERTSSQFAVIRIQVPETAPDKEVLERLASALRQSDVLAAFGPNEYEVLLVDTRKDQAEQIAGRVVAALAAIDVIARCNTVYFPYDGRSAHALMTKSEGKPDDEYRDDLIVAEPSMRSLYELVGRIAVSDLCVLILGETGVGKEKMSQAVHHKSARADKPFVAINCAALNDSLLESELFGHERGAFTSANAAKPGLLEAAAGGTVLLDEIGDMSLAIQAKLLRVIEEGEVRRVGGLKARKIGVRFVAATNCDLESATARGTFREDLYFRLSAATIVIPPLRERISEIEPLARRFAHAAMRKSGASNGFTPDALDRLRTYSWPGNIRELRNVVERAVLLCGSGPISTEHLPVERMRGTFITHQPPMNGFANGTSPRLRSGSDERERIIEALERAGGHQGKAAVLLGVSRRTLINRLVHYNLPRPRKGRTA